MVQFIYQLKADVSVNTNNLTVGSLVNENLKQLITVQDFNLLSKAEVIKFINAFIKKCNDKSPSIGGVVTFLSLIHI